MPARSIIRPVLVQQDSPFVGEMCALCKEPFVAGNELVICPEDGSRHHVQCWRANGDKCTAYGCTGSGQIQPRRARTTPRVVTSPPLGETQESSRSKVRTMPSSNFGCAQTCLVLAVALAIVLIGAGCFGLWAIADYVLIELLGWQYRSPFTGMILPHLFTAAAALPWL